MVSDAGDLGSGSVTFAFLSGVVLGAAGALLLAPQSGRETRERLRDYAEETKDRWNRLAEQAESGIDKATEKGHQLMEEGRSRAQQTFRKGRHAAADAGEAG